METLAKKYSKISPKIPEPNYNNLLIYRTNISSVKKMKILKPFFDEHPHILDWNVDRQDVDNVLRIEISDGKSENEVLGYIRKQGLLCEALED